MIAGSKKLVNGGPIKNIVVDSIVTDDIKAQDKMSSRPNNPKFSPKFTQHEWDRSNESQ